MKPPADPLESARKLALLVYALQALALLGFGLPYVAAVVVNYVKLDEVRGTWLESHFRWQIRTFWYSLLWAVLGVLTFVLLIGWLILAADTVWIVYRIVKGWLDLSDGKEVHPARYN